jgi:hypothetical protein
MRSSSRSSRAFLFAAGFVLPLVTAGCDDDGGITPVRDSAVDAVIQRDSAVDSAVPIDQATTVDQASSDTVTTDAGTDSQVGPAAPTITAPQPNATVYARIDVEGTAEADALVSIEVLRNTTVLGRGSTTAAGDGSFSLTVSYHGASHDDLLTVSVTQTTGNGTSPARTVAVRHDAPLKIEGSISQQSGNNAGTAVYIRLYETADADKLLQHIDELMLTATDATALPATNYSFDVPDGTYYLRAFRDSSGPLTGGPDGQPTLDGDAQAAAVEVALGGSSASGQDLALTARTNTNDYYGYFDARARNDTPAATPPGDVGQGLCGGYYLHLMLGRSGDGANLTAPRIHLPDGNVITLLDDGGCGDAVQDNTASSYDFEADDGQFSYGIPDPTSAQAGDYTLFYEQTVDGFINIETDSVATIVKLPLLREGVSPNGEQINTDRTPEVTWTAVPNAGGYSVELSQSGGDYNNGDDPDRNLTGTSYTPPADLPDDACFNLGVRAFDTDPSAGDVDAESSGSTQWFCIDNGSDSSVTVSGDISDKTGKNAPIVIRVLSDSQHDLIASVRRPAGSTDYSVSVLAGDSDQSGVIQAFVDAANNGSRQSPENRAVSVESGRYDFRNDATVDLTFNPELLLSAPADGATAATLQPTFQWQDYATTAGAGAPSGAFGYALYFSKPESSGMPTTILSVPSSQTTLDLSSLPTVHFDVIPLMNCVTGGGTFSVDATTKATDCTGASKDPPSVTTLEAGEIYNWGVTVFECDFADYESTTQADVDTFVSCAADSVTNQTFYVMSVSRRLIAPTP